MPKIGNWLHIVNGQPNWGAWGVLGVRAIRHTVYSFTFTFPGGVSKVLLQDVGSFDGPEVNTVADLPEPYRTEALQSAATGGAG
jgi:hypothetical protein